jgi:hypothetical protein
MVHSHPSHKTNSLKLEGQQEMWQAKLFSAIAYEDDEPIELISYILTMLQDCNYGPTLS